MKIFLTGASGFLGSNLYWDLKNRAHTKHNIITAVDKDLTYKTSDYIYGYNLTKPLNDILLKKFKECDVVVHFAASVGVNTISKGSEPFWNSHLINQNIIQLCKQYNKKIVFASSSEVYGSGLDLKETDPLQLTSLNRSSYASEKINTEFMIKNAGIPYIILRPFNITGKGQSADSGMVLPRFIKQAKNTKTITVYGSGDQVRSFCHVDDFTEIVTYLIMNEIEGVFNIGSDNKITINELAEKVKKSFGLFNKIKIEHVDFNKVYDSEMFDIKERTPNIDKIKTFYRYFDTIDEIIQKMNPGY